MISTIISTFLDIFFTSVGIYILYYFFRDTRTATIFKGILLIFSLYVLARVLQLNTIIWIFNRFFNEFPVIIAIIFHTEIRHFFSNLGRNRKEIIHTERFSTLLSKSLLQLSQQNFGALIIIENNTKLNDLLQNGIILDARFSVELILSIFYKSSSLHDGAVIIRNEHIYAAKVLLPVTFHTPISGARHGTAISISEERDCIVFVVSEETGTISYAKDGVLTPIPEIVLEDVVHEVIS